MSIPAGWQRGERLLRHVNGAGWSEPVTVVAAPGRMPKPGLVRVRLASGAEEETDAAMLCRPNPLFFAWMAAYGLAEAAQVLLRAQEAAAGPGTKPEDLPIWPEFTQRWGEAHRLGRAYWETQPEYR